MSCLYLYIEHPTFAKEVRIIGTRIPEASDRLATQIARFVQELRQRPLSRTPGVAETLDWAQALLRLHQDGLEVEAVRDTLGCLLKDRGDLREVASPALSELVERAAAADPPPS